MKERITNKTLIQLALISGIIAMGILEATGSVWLGLALCCTFINKPSQT
jgi:hypothetical protein